jgi:dolichyl-phosphate beta-glucosyltransferase
MGLHGGREVSCEDTDAGVPDLGGHDEVYDLTVVVPAFNEADRLPATLPLLLERVAGDGARSVEVVVVDDGSRDETGTIAAAAVPPAGVVLRVLVHERNRGKGAAVRTGFAASRGRRVLISDADLATPIDELATLERHADDRSVVIGSRGVDRSFIVQAQPWYRDLMGRIFNLCVQTLAVPGVRDTQCGFKLYPGNLARALADVQRIDGFAWDVEHLVIARAWGCRIREVPVHWRHVEASRVHPVRHSTQMLWSLVGLAWRRATGGIPTRPAELA